MKITYLVDDGSAPGTLQSSTTIEFDATITETHTSSAQVTERNVEKGANISDHVRPAQDRFSAEAVVTNAPIRTPATNAEGAKGEYGQIDASTTLRVPTPAFIGIPGTRIGVPVQGSATVLKFDREFNRVRNVYDELVAIVNTPIIVTIDTGLRVYDDMVIVNLSAPRNVEDAIHFSFEAVGVRFVESRTVTVQQSNGGRKKKGHKNTKEAKEDGPEQSALSKSVTAIGSAWGL